MFKMNKKEKSLKIVRDCYQYGVATVTRGVYLETSGFLQEQAASGNEEYPGKAIDYNAYPYWLTTVNGTLPIGITGADDPDLLNAIE
jgi:hypothetical protein